MTAAAIEISTTASGVVQPADDGAEFLLAALRVAALRARLAQVELETIGIAVRRKMLSPAAAIEWLESLDAIDYLPREAQ